MTNNSENMFDIVKLNKKVIVGNRQRFAYHKGTHHDICSKFGNFEYFTEFTLNNVFSENFE